MKLINFLLLPAIGIISTSAFAHTTYIPNTCGQWDHLHVNDEYSNRSNVGTGEPGTQRNTGTWLPTSGALSFTGTSVTLTCGSVIDLNCTFNVEGQARMTTSNELQIQVLSASSSSTVPGNDSTCGTVSFGNFPWVSDPVPASDSPCALTDDVPGTINDVEVNYPLFGTIASGSIDISYNNGPAPSFDLTGTLPSWLFGSCSVAGIITLDSGSVLAY